MSYLFFVDESGHDHRNCPYEVRGGVVLHAGSLWRFIQDFAILEESCFGAQLSDFGVEIKGSRLLEKKRFRHAAQGELLDDLARRKHALSFLNRGRSGTPPTEIEFRAYGQACLEMARGVFRLLKTHGATIFASVIPRSTQRPETHNTSEFLRKDQVFLFERYFNLAYGKGETGLLVFDQTDKSADRHFIRQIERYFTRTNAGRFRAGSIVPVPLFVDSELTRAIQAADICIYVTNWCFRGVKGMVAEQRADIANEFEGWVTDLQASGHSAAGRGAFRWYSIVYVPEPYGSDQD